MKLHKGAYALLLIGVCLISCNKDHKRFHLISPGKSGVHFSNNIRESDTLHYFNYPYIYNGGGVGIADFNQDGLQDIFFTGNMVPCKLYLNKGDFRFQEISKKAGILTHQWTTGVSVVDINQDGWPDIYVCVGGPGPSAERKNLLYVNKGPSIDKETITFTESAEEYGIADSGRSTQAAFFDYDRDGDLDLYVLTHANEHPIKIDKLYTLTDGTGPSTDRLYENIGIGPSGHPVYEDVSEQAGVQTEGYGLGLAITDINGDGWPDVYVANDFISNDLMYINNRDGTFTNKLGQYFDQTSLNGMGVNVADINNDGLQDILVMDMLPESNKRQKTMTANMNFEYFRSTLKAGFSPQFIRNTLQLNRGFGPDGGPEFSEIGRLTSLQQTDWSWAPLIADFDNDGLKDVYITNGYKRDITDQDFRNYSFQADMFQKGTGSLKESEVLKRLLQLDSIFLPNYMYKNQDSLRFVNETKNWGLNKPTLSNGAAYADLDNDGDLDLVVNNLDAPAFLYENRTDILTENHYLKLSLRGSEQNRNGIGTKITAYLPNKNKLFYEYYPVQGYMSSMATGILMGLGTVDRLDSLKILWPDGKEQLYAGVKADTSYVLSRETTNTSSNLEIRRITDFSTKNNLGFRSKKEYLFKRAPDSLNIRNKDIENYNSDFRTEPLLLHMYDYNGPGIATGDINGNGMTDFYIGGSRGEPGTLFFQKMDGSFNSQQLEDSKEYEDLGALFFDADNDGDLDLYVVSGGSSVKYFDKGNYQDRLYLNDGKGNFISSEGALPKMDASGSCVVAADYDIDGDLDLFVGGMVVPGNFPLTPRSYLLEDRGGKFVDITTKTAPGLEKVGLVSTALWTDYDNDGDLDLMVAGEWMPITLFENKGGTFEKVGPESGLVKYKGWWNSLVGADLDRDGDMDYVAGNLGDNTAFKVTFEEPMRVYAKDFDKNSSIDAIFTRYVQGKEVPIAPRDQLGGQLNIINRVYTTYNDYAESDIHKLLGALDTTGMQVLEANYFKSSYVENLGNGKFKVSPLPLEAQFAPLMGIQVDDLDSDGHLDIVGVGNYYATEVVSGWYDAGKGVILRGNGQGVFTSLPISETGFVVGGDARALARLSMDRGKTVWLATINSDSTKTFLNQNSNGLGRLKFRPNEVRAKIFYKNGSTGLFEKYLGNGYLSQSSNDIQLDSSMERISFYDNTGLRRTIELNKQVNR